MKVRYNGESFGVDGLTNGKIYECFVRESDLGLLRVIDDSDEDYLYSATNPAPIDGSSPGGKWEIVEDDQNDTLKKLMQSVKGDSVIKEYRQAL